MGRHLRWYQSFPWPFHGLRDVCLYLPQGGSISQRSELPKILILLAGECRVTLRGGASYEMTAGSVLILPQTGSHTYDAIPGGKGQQLHIIAIFMSADLLSASIADDSGSEDFRQVVQRLFGAAAPIETRMEREMEDAVNQVCDELDRRQFGFATRIYALLTQVVVAFCRAMEGGRERLQVPVDADPHEYMVDAAKEFLRQSVYSRVRLPDVAASVNLSEEHLSRIFKDQTGISVMQFLRIRRIEMAKHLLITTNDPVKLIAHRLAFEDAGHFSKVFRRMTGMTPLEYRRAHPGGKGFSSHTKG